MESETRTGVRRELHSRGFQRLLGRLDPDEARASAEYSKLRQGLVRYCLSRDEHLRAEELADQALDVVAQRLDLEDIRDVEQFAVGVLRMLLKAHKRRNREQLGEELELAVGDPSPEHTIIHRLDRERQEHCFVHCLKQLPPSERLLVFEYYPNENRDVEGRRKQLARTLGIAAGTLATRMNRLRNKLEKCCLNCYRRSFLGQPLPGAPQ